mmetsp:Transcript_5552/g.4992  ORF Transcript_5552/g.4992 Transcript_5552/m.4992 type:complete len:330 (-) Transcript_5552:45-1034(-)
MEIRNHNNIDHNLLRPLLNDSVNHNNSVNIWCHICNNQSVAEINTDDEFECIICHRTFVENLGQDLESFINVSNNNQSRDIRGNDPINDDNYELDEPRQRETQRNTSINSNIGSTPSVNNSQPPSSNTRDGAEVLQQILGRILGMGVHIGPSQQTTLLQVVQHASSESGRPVEIVVRQPANSEDIQAISSIMGRTPNRLDIANRPPTRRQVSPLVEMMESFLGPGRNIVQSENAELEQILHHILMHEQSRAGAPPASEELIRNLNREKYNAYNKQEECLISFEPFEQDDVIVTLECGHRYKEEQIIQWLKMHATCPVCRISIATNNTSS